MKVSRRTIAVVAVVLLVGLAGCGHSGGSGGGGGDGGDAIDVKIENAEELDTVAPGSETEIRASTEGSPGTPEIEYTYDSPGEDPVTESGEMDEAESDGEYVYTIEGLPAGTTVDVTVSVEDGDTKSDSVSYDVSFVESVNVPEGTTNQEMSPVGVQFTTTDGLESVTLELTRTDPETGESRTNFYPVQNPNDLPDVQNRLYGASSTEVELAVLTSATGQSETRRTTAEWEYVQETDVLYVPVSADDQWSQNHDQLVEHHAQRVDQYYETASGGAVDPAHEIDPAGLNELPQSAAEYENHHANRQPGDPSLAEVVACDAAGEGFVGDADFEEHTTVVFAVDDVQFRDHAIASPRALAGECGAVDADSNVVLTHLNRPYSVWAHELGHTEFNWDDYYGYEDDPLNGGQTHNWSLMGANLVADRPAPVQAHNRYDAGWEDRSEEDLSAALQDGRYETELTYAHEDGTALFLNTSAQRQDSVFTAYLAEARDPSGDYGFPDYLQDLQGVDSASDYDGPGVLVSGMTRRITRYPFSQLPTQNGPAEIGATGERHHSNVLYNPEAGAADPNVVTLREGEDDVLHDPDLGVDLVAEDGAADGATFGVEDADTADTQGVNVFAEIDCQNVSDSTLEVEGDCQELQGAALNASDAPAVSTLAETEDGAIGVGPDGTAVDEVPGGEALLSSRAQKVFVPQNASPSYAVQLRNGDAMPGNVTFHTQTVTWTEDGERVASEITRDSVAPDEALSPELARLEVDRTSWDAGQFRTLERDRLVLPVENTGIEPVENVSVTVDSELVSVNRTSIGAIGQAESVDVGVTVDVPAGTDVGAYDANVTISGEGVESTQSETLRVSAEVLPTARWEVASDAPGALGVENETTVATTVRNDASSNVPLYDVEPTLTGNVTRLDVDAPAAVAEIAPGEAATLETHVAIPDGGIEEGTYDGALRVDTTNRHQRFFEYPVDVPEEYVVTEPENATADATVAVHGPSVESSASFDPQRQVAMRQGTSTLTVAVDALETDPWVPVARLEASATVPDGWAIRGNGDPERHVQVWISEPNGAGEQGRRTRLRADDYALTTEGDRIHVALDDVAATRFDRPLAPGDRLEFSVPITKETGADEYEYSSDVRTEALSPADVVGYDDPDAAIDVFDPRTGTAPAPVGTDRDRVPREGVRLAAPGVGEDATLRNPRRHGFPIDGEDQWFLEFEIVDDARGHQKVAWVPLSDYDGTIEATVSEEGYALADGYVTPNVHSAVASGMANAKPVTVQLPLASNATAGEELTFTETTHSLENDSASLVLATEDGRQSAEVPVALHDGGAEASINVTVGDGVFAEPPRAGGR